MEQERVTARTVQGAKTRDECLAAAIEVFARQGYQRTTMDEIAAAAGVTKGALYWHYRSKDEFLVAALRRLNTEWENEVVGRFEGGGRAEDLLLRSLDRAVDLNLRSPWINRFFLTVALDAENIRPDVVEIMREIVRKNGWFFSALVEYGRQQGGFARDVSAADAGAALAAGYVGALAIWFIDPNVTDLRALVRAFTRPILSGLRAKTNGKRTARRARSRERRRR